MADGKSDSKGSGGKARSKPKKLFLKQAIMRRVVYALIPVLLAGIYFFGWRVLALLAVCTVGGVVTEWLFTRRRGKPISEAVFVTCFLYALSLPPTMPFWMAVVGIVVAIVFGKEVYGGFGRNFCNPAIVGRAFVYVAFPIRMTGSFVPAFRGLPGGFGRWSLATMAKAPAWLQDAATKGVDAMTAATPMWARRDFDYITPARDLFLGTIGGVFQGEYGTQVLAGGSIGETSALIILLSGAYLLWTKTANYRLTVSTLVGAVGACVLFRTIGGAEGVPPLPFTLFSGALLYGAVFMVTDPISAPKKQPSMWIYGAFIGVMIVFLRWQAQFAGAVAFAILFGNIIGPTVDMGVKAWEARQKAKAQAAEAQQQPEEGEEEPDQAPAREKHGEEVPRG